MKKGFTLLELIVVIIIIGILATLGFTQYAKVVEKGRTVEAKAILGQLRTAQKAYFFEKGVFTATIAELPVDAPANATPTHYFIYGCASSDGKCTATRSTSNSSKTPKSSTAYTITVDQNGTWGGDTAGYY